METVNQSQSKSSAALSVRSSAQTSSKKPHFDEANSAAPNASEMRSRVSQAACLRLIVVTVIVMVAAACVLRNFVLGVPIKAGAIQTDVELANA